MASRGRPVLAGSDADKIAKANARPIRVYRSKKCECTIKTPIRLMDAFCTKHGNELTVKESS